ncbi:MULTISPECIES: inositol monophosphatase family protein [unclassified Neisseria]|uniref:inositol monophosphatase family protein n=1 Tax=unclassified Neisseria TaxID=2623750 RepID=UPI00266526CB|nr:MULTISPECIES: inositol monophosphatase family protein [unclassified Neisseria]MDO1510331.1 inositol monophosphatase family protein [Neisseria sp. MVDL19-042950]MDO1516500.1 inositol monophosphatase family protein [Neisseria sp. MVDL18-041461]MDO1563707.1 inositol monophosphatase family protein [Neisseria sp. MVDL20-010259]
MLDKLHVLVREVARSEVMPRFLDVAVSRKPDGSLLTEADLAAQAAFAVRLPDIIDCPMLGEEMTLQRQMELWRHGRHGLWVVDPIDGTNNFINGLPHFALSCAYVKNGRSQMGVIYNPVSDECFYAERGKGAFLNGRPLPARNVEKQLHEAIAGVEIKYLRSGKLSSRMNTLAPFGSLRSMGSSTLDWCYLAAGRYDIYVHGGQKLWDYAAGALILEEAGGCIATLEGDDFWSGEHVFKRSVIAGLHQGLFARWLKWIRENQ